MVHLQAWRQGFGGLSYGIVEPGKFVHWREQSKGMLMNREQPDLGLMIQGSGTCCFVGTDVCSISSHFCQLQLQDCWSIRITQPGSRTWSPEILESKYRISSMTCKFTCMNSSEKFWGKLFWQLLPLLSDLLSYSADSSSSLIIPYWCPASEREPLLRFLGLPGCISQLAGSPFLDSWFLEVYDDISGSRIWCRRQCKHGQ